MEVLKWAFERKAELERRLRNFDIYFKIEDSTLSKAFRDRFLTSPEIWWNEDVKAQCLYDHKITVEFIEGLKHDYHL